jgi:phenylpropionate dioxygenase-like ring-hydroxylating dioxygenase large terminal subunit
MQDKGADTMADVAGRDARDDAAIDLEGEGRLASCGALKRFWYVACLATELGRDKPLPRMILDVPLALFRDKEGVARAVTDRCLHRAAALSAGVVIDGNLCCPYHGWTYDGGGHCVHIPSLGPSQRGTRLSDADHGKAGLKLAPDDVGCLPTWPTLEQDGLVYVYLGGSVDTALRPPFRVPHRDDPAWHVYFMVTSFDNGVTNLVENFMDVPHTVFVHEGWFRKPAAKCVPATVERCDGSVVVTYQQESDKISGLGFLLNPRGAPMVHTDKFFIPNITRVDYLFGETSGFVINSQCTPVGPTSSMVYTAISFKLPMGPLSRPVGKVLEPLIHWYTRQVITQDTDIMEIQKRGLTRGAQVVRFTSTEADLLHRDIELYRRWLLDGAVGDGPGDANRSIEFWI